MKVLILGSGRSYHATRWANALRGRGLDVAFASCHPFERPLDESIPTFRVHPGPGAGYFLGAADLRRRIEGWKPDILHVHYASGYSVLGRLSGFSPRLVSVYGQDIYSFPRRSPLHRSILAYGLSGAAAVLSTSEAMADEFLQVFPSAERPAVTPFGVDIERFRPRTPGGARSRPFAFGIVKKLEDVYGIDILLRAFGIFRDRHPGEEAVLRIVGSGSRERDLKSLSRDLGLDAGGIFLGALPNSEVPAFLSDLDIFVVPSRMESFGVAAVEAQACGLPVIASDTGGLPEVVRDGSSGLIVPPEDPVALADAMERLYRDPELRARMGSEARKNVERLYDWSRNVDAMIGIYGRAAAGRTGMSRGRTGC